MVKFLMIKRLFVLLSCIWLISACSEPQQVNNFVKGSFASIEQQHQGKPYLIMFWSEDCAYCMKELELFGQMLQQYPEMMLVTVATDPFLDKNKVREKLASFNLQQTQAWVFSEPYAETLYFDVDKRWRGELPLTFLVDSQNQKTKKIGMLSENTLASWLTQNTRKLISVTH